MDLSCRLNPAKAGIADEAAQIALVLEHPDAIVAFLGIATPPEAVATLDLETIGHNRALRLPERSWTYVLLTVPPVFALGEELMEEEEIRSLHIPSTSHVSSLRS